MEGMVTQQHPWSRYVALGDSFTEGIGDPEPTVPGGHRGWADRVAEVLSQGTEDFAYANLAVRGKLIQQIIDEQLEPALALRPDLITISAGGNDVIRPRTDPDEISARFEYAIERLSRDHATIVIFTGVDVGFSPVFRGIRGKVAIYNENLRTIAKRYDCIVADQWALTEIQDQRMWSPDRLHLNSLGHHTVARMVLAALNVENDLEPMKPEPLPTGTLAAGARRGPLVGARVPRAVGAPPHPPPVVGRPHLGEATGCRSLLAPRLSRASAAAASLRVVPPVVPTSPCSRSRARRDSRGATTCRDPSSEASSTSGTVISCEPARTTAVPTSSPRSASVSGSACTSTSTGVSFHTTTDAPPVVRARAVSPHGVSYSASASFASSGATSWNPGATESSSAAIASFSTACVSPPSSTPTTVTVDEPTA